MDEDAAFQVIAAYEAAFGPVLMPVGWDYLDIAPVAERFLREGQAIPEDYEWQTLPDGALI
ncbi:hypothetical protein UFOVP166_14 [uncultured Caudovirales phage]|uniref:Uncharacterized protein n=1 Tax=uncultured Caudovirales phage TaxID=2100421 RepID=A0A6J7WA39_9CAUD|nr:hypothetical protein UFOVP166_14 [uncultured Caudovirales phage]